MTAGCFARLLRHAAIAGLAVITLAPPAHAQEDRDAAFKDGLDARDDKKWQEAAAHMRRAIEADPHEDTRRISRGLLGVRGRHEYLPHYFLGEALFNLGDCAGAVDAWSTSEQQGVIKVRADYLSAVEKGYAACEKRGVLPPSRFTPLLARTRQHVTDVTSQAAAISERGKAHLSLWRADASLREQYDRAAGELQNAQSRLIAASRTRSERDFADAHAAADRARAILASLGTQFDAAILREQSVRGLITEVEQALTAAQEQDRAIDAKRSLLTPQLAGARQAANEAIGRARSQLNAGRTSSNVATLNEARTIAGDAAARFRQILEEIAQIQRRLFEERLAEALAAAQETFSFADGAFQTLDARFAAKAASVTPEMTAQREELQKQYAGLQRRLESARRASNIAALEQAAQQASGIRAQLDAIIGLFGPVTIIDRGVRPELAEGARLFFAGEYEQALAWLDADKLGEIPLQLHLHLFRAAAQYALYVRSAERDRARLAQAQAEVGKCRQLNPAFQPDPRAFAPRFISFYRSPSP